jgi:addiction module HigA family antidote
MQPRNRKPTTPGELLSDMLNDLAVSSGDFARHIDESHGDIADLLIDQELRITPRLARKFGDAFAQSPEFWLNAQLALDVWSAHNDFEPTPMLPAVRECLIRDRDDSEMPPDNE